MMTNRQFQIAIVCGVFLAFASVFAAEAPKRGMVPEDYFAIQLVSDPRISPDGKSVVYTLGTADQKRNRRFSGIWIVPADGSRAPLPFTTAASSAHPRWSPDGKALAFLSSRAADGETALARAQIYLLSMSGGEAVRLTNFADGVSDFEWSRDGKRIACVSRAAANRSTDVRHYLSAIYKFDPSGWYDNRRSNLWIMNMDTRATRQITSEAKSEDTEPRWSPDGSKIVFISQDTGKYPGTGGSVAVVSADGGAVTHLSNQDGLVHSPRWSEDGKRIAYISSPDDSLDARIWLTSPAGAHSELASKTLDVVPIDLDWVGGHEILFTAWAHGEQQLFRLQTGTGVITQTTRGSRFVRGQEVDEKAGKIAYVETDPAHLGEIFVADLNGKNARQLSRASEKMNREIAFQQSERMEYATPDGFKVEAFFTKPVGWREGQSYPMILCIHGGPGGMWAAEFYHDFQMFAAKGWAVLYINPRGSSGYGEKFQRAVVRQWGGKTYDDLMQGVDVMLEKYPWIDRNRLGVRGASFGGFMTNWIVSHTNRFRAAVTLSSISNFISVEGTRDMAYSHAKDFGGDLFENFDFYWSQSPLKYAKNVKTPTLVMHGDADARVPLEQSEQWFRALQHYGVPSEFVVFPRENHSIALEPKHRYENLRWQIYWFDRYLNGNTAASPPDAEPAER